MAAGWDAFWARNRGGRFTKASASKRRVIAVLDRYVTAGMHVLDAGCGSGFFSRYFLERNCRVSAVDSSQEALTLTKNRTGGECEAYLCEDFLDESFGANHGEEFDLVFTDGLLEHFSPGDQEKMLSTFYATLRPGGLIASFVPNKHSLWNLVRPLVMRGIPEKPFVLGDLVELHQRHVKVVETGGVSVVPLPVSPDQLLGGRFGMLLYVIGRK